uniref:Uncharacterized protein n=1 Tax=viral metagenome TaxID=1070528 RepID=A0A6C0D1F9_9ZZZZ
MKYEQNVQLLSPLQKNFEKYFEMQLEEVQEELRSGQWFKRELMFKTNIRFRKKFWEIMVFMYTFFDQKSSLWFDFQSWMIKFFRGEYLAIQEAKKEIHQEIESPRPAWLSAPPDTNLRVLDYAWIFVMHIWGMLKQQATFHSPLLKKGKPNTKDKAKITEHELHNCLTAIDIQDCEVLRFLWHQRI